MPLSSPSAAIPVIDLQAFCEGDRAERRRIARQIDAACRHIGFLVVSGHGVAETIQTDLYQAGKAFFDLPLAEKLKIRRPRNDQNRAYIPYGEETLARMHGRETPPDFKEVFAIGPIDVPDQPYYRTGNWYPSFAPNLWPERPAELRPAMEAYWRALEQLMQNLAAAFAVALEVPDEYFEERLDKHTSQLRLLHYPAPPDKLQKRQLRCGVHTDLGMMTILRNEDRPGGLQVRRRDGRWIDAPALENTFVVNLGDLMMRWTNDRWVSTPHRVIEPPAEQRADSRRLSMGFFVGPNYDAMVECLPGCSDTAHPAKYEAVSAHDYRTGRFAAGAGLKTAVGE